jgi:hypothetical protein
MDTPGFDTDKEQDVFKEIIRGIKAVRSYAKIVGVMLVTRINDNRAEAVDNKLLTFVNKLCGPEYAAQITVVTNFWNVSEPEEKVEFETRLGQRLQRWRSVLGQEVKQYHHGRRYNSFGEDVGECLKWRGDSERVKAYAKAMVVRNYEEIDPKDPSIVYELSENRPQGMTAAGEFLGIAPPPQSSSYSSTSASSPGHPEGTTSSSSTPKPEAEEIPKPSASSHRASQSQPQTPKEQNGPSPLSEALVWGLNNFIIPMAKQAITDKLNGRQTGGAFGGAAGGFPSYFGRCKGTTPLASNTALLFFDADTCVDFLSSEDHFKARGLPGDLGYRTQWAQARGITQDPGSSEFGDLVRRAIMRESPLS